MKTLKPFLFSILVFSILTVFSQTNIEKENEKPFIEVTGVAEKEVIPNEIYIAITLRERNEGKEKNTIENQEADLKKALTNIDIPLDNLFLSDANANYVKVKWSKKDVISKTEYLLKVEDATTVGKVFEKLDELKIDDAYISKVSHSNLLELKKEVRIMAIKAAKEKSDYLLASIGQQTGKALKVNELNPAYLQDDAYLNVRGARSDESLYFEEGIKLSNDPNQILQFQKIKLQASIYVKFEIL